MDKVAIVILNWNGVKMLSKYMDTLLEHSRGEATVYVADNASTDESVPFLKEHYPEVRLIQLEKNWGFADGYNKALQQVEATYYILLNSDVEVTPHWLEPLTDMRKWQLVSRNSCRWRTKRPLNMRELVVALSTNTAIRSVGADSLTVWKMTTDSMTTPVR